MLLTVKNLGPIQEGAIDLSKKFYVFVGYNNSGKTYMAHLLWTIFNPAVHLKFLDYIEHASELEDWVTHQNSKSDYEINSDVVRMITRQFAHFLMGNFPEILNIEVTHFIVEMMSLNFDLDEQRDMHAIKACELSIAARSGWLQRDGNINRDEIPSVCIKTAGSLRLKLTYEQSRPPEALPLALTKRLLGWSLLKMLFGTGTPFYLPASRMFHPNFYEDVFREEKNRKDQMIQQLREGKGPAEIIQSFKSKYTEPINQLFKRIYDLNRKDVPYFQAFKTYQPLVEKLEPVIGGEIIVRPRKIEGISPLIEFFLKVDQEKELEFYLSSSTMNQLSCLYLFFQAWAQEEQNFLIIDEPEENLHPAHQLKLLDILIKFANCHDNKVLITTHSPLLTEALNNHLNLGVLQENGVNLHRLIETHRLDIDPETALQSKEVGIYFFDGERIHKYAEGPYGTLFADFNAVERRISDIREILTDEIYDLIQRDDQHDAAHSD